MRSFTIKGIPDDLYDLLRRRAAAQRRSINAEILVCLERALASRPTDVSAVLARADGGARARERAPAHGRRDPARPVARPAVIVVDTNVFAYLYLPGDMTEAARGALRRDPDWVAPLLWRSELRNVLATACRAGHLPAADAVETMDAALDHMAGREFEVDSAAVLRLAHESGCAAYDCEFVALAVQLGVPLVTADRGLLEAFPHASESLATFGTGTHKSPTR